MTEEEDGFFVVEWRVENLSHWRAVVHGKCIRSPEFDYYSNNISMQLYPKGISGQDENSEVRFSDNSIFPGELSISGGCLLWRQLVEATENPPPGPKFKDVLSGIRESGDSITLRLRIEGEDCYQHQMCTTINVFKTVIKMSPRWMQSIESGEIERVCYIRLPSWNFSEKMSLLARCERDSVLFAIRHHAEDRTPFLVEVCLCLIGGGASLVRSFEADPSSRIFRNSTFWILPDYVDKTHLGEELISLDLTLEITTGDFIQSPSCRLSCDYSSVSFAPKDQDFSVFTLKSGDVMFPVHTKVLRASVFQNVLSGRKVIEDLDPSTLGLFLTYLYTGSVVEDLQSDRALKLYYAANTYGVPSLKRECVQFLCSNVSLSNVCDILCLVDKTQDQELSTAAHDFVLNNLNAVLESTEWEILKGSEPELAVSLHTKFAVEDVRKRRPREIGDSVTALTNDLMCLFQDQDFSDITLKCESVSFAVHKNILCARSPVFKTMLSCDMTESASGQVVVEDLDPSTLSLFLTYLYTGAVEDLQSDRALKLYYAADKYQVPSLKGVCGDYLRSKVSSSNVCDILSLTDKHHDEGLIAVSRDFILDNYNEVLKSKEWETLKRREPMLVANTLTQFAVDDRVRKHDPQ